METGYAPSSGGRRPLMYSLNQGIFYVLLAVAMDRFTTTRIVLMDMQNRAITDIEKFDLSLTDSWKRWMY